MTIEWVHPGLVIIFGALLIPLLRGLVQQIYLLALPAVAIALVLTTGYGTYGTLSFLDFDLVLGRVDQLSLVFTSVFSIILLIGSVYALHLRDSAQHVAAFIYAGSALGVVLAGDLVTLYVFWEMMLFSSVWLIWLRRRERSWAAGWRYMYVHVVGGLLLLGGVVLYYLETGSIAFDAIESDGPAFYLILVGFMINAAVPPLHAWLSDAYPEGTITGAVFLGAFTTKTAVYTLIRGYPGVELLVWFGTIMALYGVVYAVLVNDIRRLLAYHIISQVGYMVAGVGLGTAIAINGAASHAFTHILYKALLFMGAGAVIHVTGRSRMTELGGLYRWMPVTFLLYMIGALSISAFPLFSGFVSKTMVVEAAAEDHRATIWLLLSMASAGTFLHTGLKLPYSTWMGENAGLRASEPPKNMLVAMGMAAFLCVFIGIYPAWLYAILPFPVDYNAYTKGHVLWELQLLLFTGLGFFLMLKYLKGKPKISIDIDWLYRWLLPRLYAPIQRAGSGLGASAGAGFARLRSGTQAVLHRGYGTRGLLSRTWSTGAMAIWVSVALAGYMLINYL